MRVLVIGAGAAGLMAALRAAESGCKTVLLEKNEKAGKKLYITGKGRCNLTNACDFDTFQKNIMNGGKFMYSSLRAFGPEQMMRLLEENGCPVKTERGNRVFPVSDHASDVSKALLAALEGCGVRPVTGCTVRKIEKDGELFTVTAVRNGRKELRQAEKVVVCTGGLSYPSTGSTGDGYRFAEAFGHTVTERFPSLVSLETEEEVQALAGISLKNVRLRAARERDGKPVFEELGELLFTHRGISGPLVLSLSALLAGQVSKESPVPVLIDLKPGLEARELDARLLRDFEKAKNSDLGNALSGLLISGIRQEVLRQSGISGDRKVHDVTKQERTRLEECIRALRFTVTGTGSFEEAVITRGGVKLSEINPRSMESRLIPGLYFAGEVLDIDALTGGFNLQLAWSTGAAAGTVR